MTRPSAQVAIINTLNDYALAREPGIPLRALEAVLMLPARSAGSILTMYASVSPASAPLRLDDLLALICFAGRSAGSEMAVIGEHLLAQVETAARGRWAAGDAVAENWRICGKCSSDVEGEGEAQADH